MIIDADDTSLMICDNCNTTPSNATTVKTHERVHTQDPPSVPDRSIFRASFGPHETPQRRCCPSSRWKSRLGPPTTSLWSWLLVIENQFGFGVPRGLAHHVHLDGKAPSHRSQQARSRWNGSRERRAVVKLAISGIIGKINLDVEKGKERWCVCVRHQHLSSHRKSPRAKTSALLRRRQSVSVFQG